MKPAADQARRRATAPAFARRAMLAGFGLAAILSGADAADLQRTADLRFGRAVHTVTALTDGRFLVTGGFSTQPEPVPLAEIFDPAAGVFRTISPMAVPRFGHTASLLPDGTVLIAGGWDGSGAVLAAAELFDPATETFRPLPPLHETRAGHAAVMLADGRALLIGGVGAGQGFLASAEAFDHRTGRFTRVGRMGEARENLAAVRLSDGRVLVCGGHHGRRAARRILASAELFDPGTNRFTFTGALRSPRHKHDAVLLPDGRVLITGGASRGDTPGDTTEFYDPAAGIFSSGPRLQRSRFKHFGTSVLLADGTVLVLGGASQPERFLPAANRFELLPSALFSGAESYAATARSVQGNILHTGGYGDGIRGAKTAWLMRPERQPAPRPEQAR